MAWEQHGNHRYYYRSHKVGGRVVKEYVGAGATADLIGTFVHTLAGVTGTGTEIDPWVGWDNQIQNAGVLYILGPGWYEWSVERNFANGGAQSH